MRNTAPSTSSSAINTVLIGLVLAAASAQLLIDFRVENLASVCIVTWVSLIVLLYLRWSDALATHPLSTYAVFGFCVTTQMGALVSQSAFWTPLAYELRQPVTTFATLALFQLIALGAHMIYRRLPSLQFGDSSMVRSALAVTGVYRVPSVGMLWIFGLIGFAANLLGGGADAEVGGKITAGFRFLIYAPFLIPLYLRQQGKGYCNARLHYLLLLLFFAMVVLLAVAANTRGMMLTGIVTIGLVVALELMRDPIPITSKDLVKYGAIALVAAAALAPLSDLSTAMAVARSTAGAGGAGRGPLQMVKKTYEIMQRPSLIAAYRLRSQLASRYSAYDENYIANPMLARLVETKFHDNSLFFASSLSASSAQALQKTSVDMLWAILPEPLLKRLHTGVKKDDLNFSMGDYLLYLNKGQQLGGRKTGSVFAQGLALFGALFPIIYFFFVFILFALLDLLSFKDKYGRILLTVPAMVQIFGCFIAGITGESLTQVVMKSTRGFIQTLLIYAFVYYFARFVTNLRPFKTVAPPRFDREAWDGV
jgi:hypothetical protein